MFASQLLRILEAIPGDVKCERTSIERAKGDMTMKENQHTLDNPDSYITVDGCQDSRPSVFKVKGVDECWKLNLEGDISTDDGLASGDSVKKVEQNELLHNPKYRQVHTNLPSSGIIAKEIVEDSLEHEFSLPIEDATLDESTFRDSTSTQIAASDLFDAETYVFTDKNVLEFEFPELMVCCKEVKQIVKDISIDEATPSQEVTSGATDQTANAASEEDSFVDRKLPIEEFGTRSFLRSFVNTTDREGNKAAHSPDEQCLPGKASSPGTKVGMLRYDSKVENGSITFDFCTKGRTETIEDNNCVASTETTTLDHKDTDSNKNGSTNDASEANLCKDDVHRTSSEYSHVEQGKPDMGESSFSAANPVPYSSGSIAFSGSISLRSDGSTTSARSFAFPVLQAEWSSSPVRMARADGRHFRKHKCWRSGLLCCRF